MTARLLLLCPGQGGQHEGMFDLARTDAGAAAMLDACRLSGPDPESMFENRMAQPLIVGATLAMWQALRNRVPAPSLVAGYSVGELSAYGVAGALAPRDAVDLASIRARLMDSAAMATQPQALAAVSALPLERARELAAAHGFAIAIVTAHDSCIAGGLEASLGALERDIVSTGGRLQRLPVGIASHTDLMTPAVAPFSYVLSVVPFAAQACPVLSGIGAEAISGKPRAVETLARQLNETIMWSDCMDAAAEAGMTVALELGPGAALSRMLRSRHPQIDCRSAADFRGIEGIVAWLGRHFD